LRAECAADDLLHLPRVQVDARPESGHHDRKTKKDSTYSVAERKREYKREARSTCPLVFAMGLKNLLGLSRLAEQAFSLVLHMTRLRYGVMQPLSIDEEIVLNSVMLSLRKYAAE